MLKKILATCLLSLLPASQLLAASDTTPAQVSPSEQIQFQQKTVEAQMQELQERMFHLADLTRDTEPDDSSRLIMAVRKAREDLIIEQMRDCVEELGRVDLSKAADEQEQVLAKLNELKKLLTTTDLDLQMQLDKLKKLNDAIAKLDQGIKEERREQKQNGEFASAKGADHQSIFDDRKQKRSTAKSQIHRGNCPDHEGPRWRTGQGGRQAWQCRPEHVIG